MGRLVVAGWLGAAGAVVSSGTPARATVVVQPSLEQMTRRSGVIVRAVVEEQHVAWSEGRARILAEVADLEAKAETDIAAARSRSGDELRAQIAQIATVATQQAVSASLNDSTKQELIEGFINSVGGAR